MLFWTEWIVLTPEAVEGSLSDVPGLYEIKVEGRLVEYPSGRSAMVYYGRTTPELPSLRQQVLADWFSPEKEKIRRDWEAFGPLVFRWSATPTPDGEHARRMRQFIERFGRAPHGNPDEPLL